MAVRKPIELPPKVAHGFVRALKDYSLYPIRRDAIAARLLDALRQSKGSRERKLRLNLKMPMRNQTDDSAWRSCPSRGTPSPRSRRQWIELSALFAELLKWSHGGTSVCALHFSSLRGGPY